MEGLCSIQSGNNKWLQNFDGIHEMEDHKVIKA
jgi:hypothetical protein